MRDTFGREASPAEQKFWTRVKVHFFCEEDETPRWSDIFWMVAIGVTFLWVVLLVVTI